MQSQAWELRQLLKEPGEEGSSLFVTLYPAWAHNPVALLAVCLLAQAHEHAAALVLQFGSLEMTVPLLVQIDRLVQVALVTPPVPQPSPPRRERRTCCAACWPCPLVVAGAGGAGA